MEPKVKKILVLRDEEIPNLSTVVKMAYCELLPYSQQSGFTKYPEYSSRIWAENVPNGNAAWLTLNRYRLAFFGFVETYRQFRHQWYEIESDNECDYYIICCISNRREDYLLDRLSRHFNASIEEISPSRSKEDQPADEFKESQPTDKLEVCKLYSRKIVNKIKSLCGITGKPSIGTEEVEELARLASSYVMSYYSVEDKKPKLTEDNAFKAYISFNVEWSKLIYFNAKSDEFNLMYRSTYGEALTVFIQSAELLSKERLPVEIVEWLCAFVYCYEINPQSIRIYGKELYLSLSVCWHKLGEGYDIESIYSLRRHLLYMFREEAGNTYPLENVYGFRKVSTYFLEALIGHTLNTTSPFVFNDPFDTPILRLYEGRRLGKLIKEAFKDTLKISCFSKPMIIKPKSGKKSQMFLDPLMWAHYADNHKGVCIKYCFERDLFCNGRARTVAAGFKDVKYSSVALANSRKKSKIKMDDAFFLKGTDWKYENERRLFCFDINGKGSFGHYGDTAGCIEAVYFGLRCPNEDKKAIIQILRCNHGTTSGTVGKGTSASGSGIKFYQMTMNNKKFGTLKENELSMKEIHELLR